MKIAVIGCGLRTPLLINGLARSGLPISLVSLYDIDHDRVRIMTELSRQAARGHSTFQVLPSTNLDETTEDSSFVISSIRVGGMEARAADERVAVEHGFAGQETTGPAGFAMALRTVPVAVEHARAVERKAPKAWVINFTNPAGLITQAIATYTEAKVVGICDTPAELFFRIALALEERPSHVECEYFGLNHLGWVRHVLVNGEDATRKLLDNESLLSRLYPAQLFSAELIQSLALIPTEYLFFYYQKRLALQNQLAARATRGEELQKVQHQLFLDLEKNPEAGLQIYRRYLNRRNASYLKLEGSGESAFTHEDVDWDPFEGETGYHRIAVDAIRALCSDQPAKVVLNVLNRGTISELAPEDVIEVPCMVDRSGPQAAVIGTLPEVVRGLTVAVKTYERLAIRAAMQRAPHSAALALFANPIVADWGSAVSLAEAFQRVEVGVTR
jgi:6-phospho-beta-glucosidase